MSDYYPRSKLSGVDEYTLGSGPTPEGEAHHFLFGSYSEAKAFLAGVEFVNDKSVRPDSDPEQRDDGKWQVSIIDTSEEVNSE